MKNKGFTLVEVLGVIILLAIIGMIIVPTIGSQIEKQKDKAFNASLNGLLEVVKKQSQTSSFKTLTYKFQENSLYLCDDNYNNCSSTVDLNTDGKIKNGNGFVKVSSDGLSSLDINTDKYCSFKNYFSKINVSTDTNYCDFGKDISSISDKAIYYDRNTDKKRYSISSGNMVLTHVNDIELTTPITVSSTILGTLSGYIEIEDASLLNMAIGNSYYCANYSIISKNEIIDFKDTGC
jgi:prepilin-type N-terminal cleavage/methylation domain-containing protein